MNSYLTNVKPIIFGLLGIILVATIGFYLLSIHLENKSQIAIQEGMKQERQHLKEIHDTESCTEKNILLIQYSGGFWNKTVYDQMFQDYRDNC